MAQPNTGRKWTTALLSRIGILGAIASVLYVFPEIPIIPPMYKLDFSTIPALLAGYSMGSIPGLLVLLIKDLVGLTHSSSLGVGELADFLMSGVFVVAASLIYQKNRSFKGALTGMLIGTAFMGIVGALVNYFIIIPFYISAFKMSSDAIIGMVAMTIPAVDSLWKLILLATLPFNLLKGLALCLIAVLIYKRLSPLLHVRK